MQQLQQRRRHEQVEQGLSLLQRTLQATTGQCLLVLQRRKYTQRHPPPGLHHLRPAPCSVLLGPCRLYWL